jgi:hypothetical protein
MHQQISSSLLMSLPVDPDDGLVADEVGPWATEKHERLKRYIDASRGARMRFLPPKGAGASYIELFCGAGRSLIRDTSRFTRIDHFVSALIDDISACPIEVL